MQQMLSVLQPPAAVQAGAPLPAAANGLDTSASEAAAAVPARGKGRPPKAAAAAPAEAPAEAPPTQTEQVAGPTKSAQDIRHDAVLVLKKVYTKGPQGQAEVDKICKHFNVTKLVDVPLERAVELLQMSNRALHALGG